MPKQSQKRKKEGTYFIRNPRFAKLYATNVNVYSTQYDFRIETMNERMRFEDHTHLVVDGVLILTPQSAKKLHDKLGKLINEYEKEHQNIEDSKLDNFDPNTSTYEY